MQEATGVQLTQVSAEDIATIRKYGGSSKQVMMNFNFKDGDVALPAAQVNADHLAEAIARVRYLPPRYCFSALLASLHAKPSTPSLQLLRALLLLSLPPCYSRPRSHWCAMPVGCRA